MATHTCDYIPPLAYTTYLNDNFKRRIDPIDLGIKTIQEDITMERKRHSINTHTITPNKLGDTRSTGKIPTFREFEKANLLHRADVRGVMNNIASLMKSVALDHDITKDMYNGEFYRDFCIKLTHPEEDFTKMPWYQGHIKAERHHINDDCPDDVDLIDILEHIVDCVCAGMARNDGEVYPIEISNDILQRAVANTQKLIEDSIILDTETPKVKKEDISFT